VQTLESALDPRSAQEAGRGLQLTRRAALNSLAAGIDLVARVGVELVLNPLLVGRLGDHLYGAWRVLWRFTGSLSATSGRSAQALKWSIANRLTSTDYREKRELVGSALGVWLLFLPILALIGGVLAWLAPSLLETPPEFRSSVRWAAALLVGHVILSTVVDLPRAILQGENLGYKRIGLSTALVILGGGLMALAVIMGTGIVGVAAANLANALLTGILFVRIVRSHVEWAGIARPSMATIRRFVGLSWWFAVWKLVMQAMLAGDVVILGIVDSVESVTTYTLTRFAPETVLAGVAVLIAGLLPGLGGLVGSGNWSLASRVRAELMATTWLVTVAAGATLLVWNRAFIELWVGGAHYAGTVPTLLIVIAVTQFALIRNDARVIDLTLSIRGKVLLGLLSAALSVALAAVFVGHFGGGITGLCIGFIAGRAVLTVAYPRHVGRLLGLSWRQQLAAVLRPAAVAILLFALAFLWAGSATASTWPALILGSSLTFVAIASLSFFLGLSSGGRDALRRRARKVFRLVA
jgi:O-antigen/teichoic acid export membrane protein